MLSPEMISLISHYGYLAIFLLVFLQEVGAPNPLPNELLLLFAGYLSFAGALFFPWVILAAVAADLLGTSVLYLFSFSFGNYILKTRPRWLPIPYRTIEKLLKKVSRSGLRGIFIGRLSPFIRGYLSVITGLLQVRPRRYYPIAVATAFIWSLAYVVTGYLLGPYWSKVVPHLQNFGGIMLGIFLLLVVIIGGRYLVQRSLKNEQPTIND